MPAPTSMHLGVDHSQAPASGAKAEVFSLAELRAAVDQLMKEKVQNARMTALNRISCRCSASAVDLQLVAEALTTCWLEKRYSGVDSLKWLACIICSAERPTQLAQDAAPEIFALYLELAIKGTKWCAQIISSDPQENCSLRDFPSGAAEAYVSGECSLFEGPLALTLESLVLSSFELAKVVYASMMKRPFQQPQDDDGLRKRCQGLLNLAFRVVLVFRRQIDRQFPVTINNCRKGSSPESGWQSMPTALRVVASSVKSFTDLGKLSTSGGEMSFALLSLSWKSIMALLQVDEGRDTVASAVAIPPLIAILISNATQALKRAVETWLLLSSSSSGEKDPRRLCIPIRFFLQTALRISSCYPLEAIMVSRNMVSCTTKVCACLLLQKIAVAQKAAVDALAELVVPTAFTLLHNLFSAQRIETDRKIQLLHDITSDMNELESSEAITDLDGFHDGNEIVDELFSNRLAASPGAGLLKSGSVVVFLSVLQGSGDYHVDLVLELLRKMSWLLEAVPEEGMYFRMTQKNYLPVNVPSVNGKWDLQLMFSWVSRALQIFAVVAAKDLSSWVELKCFLFQQVLHPCVICGELIVDVWCFIIRQSDSSVAQDDAESLLFLLKDLTASNAEEPLRRRLARVICCLIQVAPQTVAARVFERVFHDDPFSGPAGPIPIMLLQEGFSFNLLNGSQRKAGFDRLLSTCIAGGQGLCDSLKRQGSAAPPSSLGSQKQALSCLLLLLSESAFGCEPVEERHMQEIKQIAQDLISMYTQEHTRSQMFHSLGIIGPALELIPHVQHMLDPNILQALLPRLLKFCQPSAQMSQTNEQKQPLAEFLANLSDICMEEVEENPAMKSLWGLYHSVLREKHWALVHSGLQSFSHFAAHTSCQELWRFVPMDAGVVPDGNTDEDAFMTALKVFIEKEGGLTSLDPVGDELERLRAECSLLQQQRHTSNVVSKQRDTEIQPIGKGGTESTGTAEIQQAVAMLSRGIGVLQDKIPEWLIGTSSETIPRQWEVLRARLAQLNAQVDALQCLRG